MYVIPLTIHGLASSAVKEVSKLVNKVAYSTGHNVIKNSAKIDDIGASSIDKQS